MSRNDENDAMKFERTLDCDDRHIEIELAHGADSEKEKKAEALRLMLVAEEFMVWARVPGISADISLASFKRKESVAKFFQSAATIAKDLASSFAAVGYDDLDEIEKGKQ